MGNVVWDYDENSLKDFCISCGKSTKWKINQKHHLCEICMGKLWVDCFDFYGVEQMHKFSRGEVEE